MSNSNNKNARDKALWDALDSYQPPFQVDTNAGIQRFKKRLNAEQEQEARVIPMGRRPWFKIAAAALILVIAAFGVHNLIEVEADWVAVHTNEIKQEVTLPDGSTVWLNAHSELSYIKDFAGDSRNLKLVGEAFFDVKRNPNKAFIIQTGEGNVTVLGTSFSIKTNSAKTEVLVKSGKVAYQANEKASTVYLTKNMKATNKQGEASSLVEENVSLNEIAWQSDVLKFRGAKVSRIIKDIEELYNVDIQLKNKDFANCAYTFQVNQVSEKTASEALNSLIDLTGMKLVQKNNTIILSAGNSKC